jgi:hypothetical protein
MPIDGEWKNPARGRCYRKKRYPNWDLAEMAAEKASLVTGDLIIAYKCVDCRKFHIGHADLAQTIVRRPPDPPKEKSPADVVIPSYNVTFTANPGSSGQSGTFSNSTGTITVATGSTGVASAGTFTANANAGAYTVTATAGGASATFSLTNTAATTVQVSVGTNVMGPTISVDGGPAFTGTRSLTWTIGSMHTFSTTSPQASGGVQ